MGKYDAVAQRTLTTIRKKGSTVTFPASIAQGTFDPLTETWTPPAPGTVPTGSAVEIPGDPDRFAALGLSLQNSVTLLIAASGLGIVPVSGMQMQWAGVAYTIKDVAPVQPDGNPILYTVIGSA